MKMMENGEEGAKEAYSKLVSAVPEAKEILQDEEEHEKHLVAMIDEERIGYIGSMVLGLNDALVELTGALAGLTLTFQNTRLLLVIPYFLLGNYYVALGVTVVDAALVVLVFSFFVSVVKEIPFKRMFLEVLFISLGVAAASFLIGWLVQTFLNIEV